MLLNTGGARLDEVMWHKATCARPVTVHARRVFHHYRPFVTFSFIKIVKMSLNYREPCGILAAPRLDNNSRSLKAFTLFIIL
jgi:hypothetical protein